MTKRWAWAPHEDGPWDETFDSREAAEEYGRTEGREEYAEVNDVDLGGCGWVGEVQEIDPAEYARRTADAEWMVERMDEEEDLGAVFDEPVFESKVGAQEALEVALAAWAKEYVTAEGMVLIDGIREVKADPGPATCGKGEE